MHSEPLLYSGEVVTLEEGDGMCARKIRKVEMRDVPVTYMAAVDNLMAQQMYDGTFQDTIVVFRFKPSLSIGVNDDGDRIDIQKALQLGYPISRRLCSGGGAAVFSPELPMISFYYRKPYKKPEVTLMTESEKNGQATVSALRRFGFPAQYKAIGDVEIELEGTRYKVAAGYAGNYELPDYWNALSSIVWEAISPELTRAYMEVFYHYPEKFEDKDAKSPIVRMKPLKNIGDYLGLKVSAEDVIEAVTIENARVLMEGEPAPSSWSPEEELELHSMVSFFESRAWIKRLSTKRMCLRAPEGARLGVGVHKARKLIKASVIVDEEGKIIDLLITGDFYIRPQLTLFSGGALRYFTDSLKGLYINDDQSLLEAIRGVFERPDLEAPLLTPEDFFYALKKGAENLVPIKTPSCR